MSDLDTSWNANGTVPQVPPEVSFGPDPSDKLTVEWASRALTWLKANRPKVFADMMTGGVFGIEVSTPGRKKASQ